VRGRPIRPAYTDTGALDVVCPNCSAQAGHWCKHPDGRSRRTPCVARLAAGVSTGNGKPYGRDFSEPRSQTPTTEGRGGHHDQTCDGR
jgi:hypothetical protein